MYEDNVGGKISDERFIKLSQTYEDEQAMLTERVCIQNKKLTDTKLQKDETAEFLRLVRRYTEINELTPEIVRTFIKEIIVHKKRSYKRQANTMRENYL